MRHITQFVCVYVCMGVCAFAQGNEVSEANRKQKMLAQGFHPEALCH